MPPDATDPLADQWLVWVNPVMPSQRVYGRTADDIRTFVQALWFYRMTGRPKGQG